MEKEEIQEKLQKAKTYKVLGADNDEQKKSKLKAILKTQKFYYDEEYHFHQSILQAVSWEFDNEVFQELYNCVYEEYSIRLYREKDIKECLINALQLSAYLILLREPEKEIVDLFNYVRDSAFWRHARESAFDNKEKSEFIPLEMVATQSAPTAYFLDGIFSALYAILDNQQFKSVNLQIALRMIETHLYPYIKSLNKQHQKSISRWGMPYNSDVAGNTLFDALKEKMKKNVSINLDSWSHYIGVGDENLKEYTNNYNIEDVRIITSLIPTKEGQEQFLSDVVAGVRNSVRELLNIHKVTFNIWEPLHVYIHNYGMKSEEELFPIDADNYDTCVDKIVNSIGVPSSWGNMIPDGEGGYFVNMDHNLPVIYYGTTEESRLKDVLYNLNYTPPKWFSLRDNPEAINFQLYKDVCSEIHKIEQWNNGLVSQDICDIIAMGFNIRENITDKGKLAPFFNKRLRIIDPDDAFRTTLLNLMGWLSSTDVGALSITVAQIQQKIIGNTADDKHRSAIKKGRGEENTPMNKNVAAAFEYLMPYLFDKINYRKQLANYAH